MWLILYLILGVPVSAIISLRGLHGFIRSPGFPQGYSNDLSLSWEISVPRGYGINLRLTEVDLESSAQCAYDYIEILTDEEHSPPICGDSKQGPQRFPFPLEFRTSGNWMQLNFKTDFSNDLRHTGFTGYYTAIDVNECEERSVCSHFCNNYIGGFNCSCRPSYHLNPDGTRCGVNCSGQIFTSFKGQFTSPNYPLPYAENSQCHYRIQIEQGFQIILEFDEDFHVEGDPASQCVTDILMITSGGREYGPFCGERAPRIHEQLDNTVDVTFSTDGRGERRGWRIKYRSTAKQCPPDFILHGVISHREEEYFYRDTVAVRCIKGYELYDKIQKMHHPSMTFKCQIDGTWNVSSIECVPVDCGTPQSLRHGRSNYTSTIFRARNTYTCAAPHYTLEASAEFECSADGEWVDIVTGSVTLPKCKPVCGKCDVFSGTGRIIGGHKAGPDEFPWQVWIISGSERGGGALVGDGWVLTAAHILQTGSLPIVRGGMTDLSENNQEGQVYLKVRKVFSHPGFRHLKGRTVNFDNDIALLQLDKRPRFRKGLSPLCMPRAGEDGGEPDIGKVGLVAGWGSTGQGRVVSELLYVNVPVLDMARCRGASYGNWRPMFTENMLCAGEAGRDSCQGDSGGPLVFQGKGGECVARGVVSFGPPNCGSQGVYTRVGRYTDWAASVMEEGDRELEEEGEEEGEEEWEEWS